MIDACETTTLLSRIVDRCFSYAQLLFRWAPGLTPAKSSPGDAHNRLTVT